jgi:hypothetical protein
MVLSDEVCVVYVLAETGVRGKLTSGRVERNTSGELDVFDPQGNKFEYLSRGRLRSWCVVGPNGEPVDGWRNILAEDLPKIFPA